MLHLIACLGNIGDEYAATRHNIGFRIADKLAADAGISFQDKRYGFVARMRVKNQELLLLKPSTYMNLSGNAVRYWMNKENIQPENLLVVADDLALPLGKIRLRKQGSGGGHNGIGNIIQVLCSEQFSRLRFGIGNDYPMGAQIKFVLDPFSDDERKILDERIPVAVEAVRNFCLAGIDDTMCKFNNK